MAGIPQGIKDQELRAIRATHRDDPPAERDLVGLAFSGGGIRSATFGLGVLQALKEVDLLGRIHYLSTVSGGGYIGAWYSANCRRARERGDWLWSSRRADWDASIRHLRRYSNYLSPDVGFFSADTWSMFTVWLRNALLVQWTVVMAVACVLLVPRLLIPLFARWYDYGDWRWIGVHCFVLAMICVAGNQQWVSREAPPWLMQASSWRYGVGLSVLGLAAVFGFRALVDFDPFHEPVDPAHALVMAALLVATGYATLPIGARLYALARGIDVERTQINFRQSLVQVWIVCPLLLSGLFIGAVLWAEVNRGHLAGYTTYGEFLANGWWHWPFPLSIVFCSLWLLSLCSVRRVRNLKAFLAASLAPFVCVAVLHALLSAIMLLLRGWRDGQVTHAFVVAPPLVLFAFSVTVVVLIGMMGRQSTESVREWWSRLGAWLLIYGTVWMIVAVAAVYGPVWVYYGFEQHPWKALSSATGWIGTVAAGLFAGHSEQTGRTDQPQTAEPVAPTRRAGRAVPVHRRALARRRDDPRRRRHEERRGHLVDLDGSRRPGPVLPRVARGAGRLRGDAVPARVPHRHQRVQPERVLSQPAGALLPRRRPHRTGGAQAAGVHRLRRRRRPGTGAARRAGWIAVGAAAHHQLRAQPRRGRRPVAAHPAQRLVHADPVLRGQRL